MDINWKQELQLNEISQKLILSFHLFKYQKCYILYTYQYFPQMREAGMGVGSYKFWKIWYLIPNQESETCQKSLEGKVY